MAVGLDRIFLGILDHFRLQRACQIDTHHASQSQYIRQNVCDFLANLLPLLHTQGGVRFQPLKVLHDFCRFDRNRHRQILGQMKLPPIPFGREFVHPTFDFGNRRFRILCIRVIDAMHAFALTNAEHSGVWRLITSSGLRSDTSLQSVSIVANKQRDSE